MPLNKAVMTSVYFYIAFDYFNFTYGMIIFNPDYPEVHIPSII